MRVVEGPPPVGGGRVGVNFAVHLYNNFLGSVTKLWFFGSVKVLDALQQACLILFKRHPNSIGSQLRQIALTEKCFHPFNNMQHF